jgi:hypothetical protein
MPCRVKAGGWFHASAVLPLYLQRRLVALFRKL